MFNHAPVDYKCPICLAVQGVESEDTMIKQDDIFYRDNLVMALINSKFYSNNPGHVIVVPLMHYENLYELPEKEANQIMKVSQQVAIAIKNIRNCDGVLIKQNNEPASEQHAFHYHIQVIPRFEGDDFISNQSNTRVSYPTERPQYSSPLREYLKD